MTPQTRHKTNRRRRRRKCPREKKFLKWLRIIFEEAIACVKRGSRGLFAVAHSTVAVVVVGYPEIDRVIKSTHTHTHDRMRQNKRNRNTTPTPRAYWIRKRWLYWRGLTKDWKLLIFKHANRTAINTKIATRRCSCFVPNLFSSFANRS